MVELLFDWHMPPPGLSQGELFLMGPILAFQKLFPTEQKLLQSIRTWEAGENPCDLIWETGLSDCWIPMTQCWCLLSMASFFKLTTLKHVRFIPADRHRECGFNSLFNLYKEKIQLCPQNLTGCSFDNPAPLAPEIAQEIEEVSGTATSKNYKATRKRVIQSLKEFFALWHHERTKIPAEEIFRNSRWNALCEIEILSHLLSSRARRIAVYAGGSHCSNISLFLEHNGFEKIYSKCNPIRYEPVQKRGSARAARFSTRVGRLDLGPLRHRELQNDAPSSSFLGAALRSVWPFS